MQFAQFLTAVAVQLCSLALLHVGTTSALFPFRNSRSSPKNDKAAALLPNGGAESSKRLPRYLMKLFLRSKKALTGDVNTIRGVFPTKITPSKRALRIVFDQDYLEDKRNWKKDELLLFMNKVKKPVSSTSKRSYVLKIYDLYSKKLVNEYKLPINEQHGWQVIQLTGWRDIDAKRVKNNKVGLKLVLLLGKRRLRIENSPFWKSKLTTKSKSKSKREPYLVVFSKDGDVSDKEDEEDTSDAEGSQLPQKPIYHDDKNGALPFERFKMLRGLDVQNQRSDKA